MLSLNILTSTLQHAGDYKECEKLFCHLLKWYEKGLGARHLYTLVIVNNFSRLLRDLNKLDESEMLNRRTVEGREEILGPHHVDMITSVYSLDLLLHLKAQYKEAEHAVYYSEK
jgi:hypothetical protein